MRGFNRSAAAWLLAALAPVVAFAEDKPGDDLEKLLQEMDTPADGAAPPKKDGEFGSIEEANRKLKGEEGEAEPEIDPVEALKNIKRLMEEAQEALSKASVSDPQATVEQQQTVIREIDKLLKGSSQSQQSALDEIEKLIRMAKSGESSGGGQGSQSKQPKPKPEPKPKPQNPRNSSENDSSHDPAKKPYDPRAKPPPSESVPRSGDDRAKWGDLQDRMREEIDQAKQDEFVPEYRERLERYFRILAGEE